MDTNTRIVVNTLAQHVRAILNTCMSLFSTRYILMALGQSDFGIFSLIGSTVAMLGFVTGALVVTTQRHLSYSYGEGDREASRQIFSNSLFIHILTAGVLIIVLAAIKPLLFGGILDINADRIDTASRVYFIVLVMLGLSVVTSPFRALFVARENIVYISIIDFLDGVFRLGLSIWLLFINVDKLELYAWMMFGIAAFNLIAFAAYARMEFDDSCLWPRLSDIRKSIIAKIMNFAGWTVYSTGCILSRNQGLAIVLNSFFGTVVNAAYGIALQVSSAVLYISQGVINAMSPQIIKAEGEDNHQRTLMMTEKACKYSFLLLSVPVIPICFEMPSILEAWLVDVPEGAVTICRFVLMAALIDHTTLALAIANQASGRIRNYSLLINTMKLLTLPMVVIILRMGGTTTSAMVCYISVEAFCAMLRLPYMRYSSGLRVRHFLSNVSIMEMSTIASLAAVAYLCSTYITIKWGFLITLTLCSITGIAVIWLTAMTEQEKTAALEMVKRKKQKQ